MKKKRWFKKSFVWFCLVAILCSSALGASVYAEDTNYVIDYYTTPFGATIKIARMNDGLEFDDRYADLTKYPDATKISDADYTYNCFTYAMIYEGDVDLISKLDDNQIFCIEDPTPYVSGTSDIISPCLSLLSFDQAQEGDLVLYFNCGTYSAPDRAYSHAAIISEKGSTLDDTFVISKWKHWDIYSHKITVCPYVNTEFTTTDGMTDIITFSKENRDDTLIVRKIYLSFFDVHHNYDYTPIIIQPPRPTMTARSTYHFAECSDCGAYHYETHNYSSMTCIDCGYFTGTSVNSVEDEVTE